MSKQYRIKTEAEFIEEFGEYWRCKVNGGWDEDMDHLFGRELESSGDQYIDGGNWLISGEMITDNPLPEEKIALNNLEKPIKFGKIDQPSTNKYHRNIHDIEGRKCFVKKNGEWVEALIDMYSVADACEIANPAQQHMLKKVMYAGLRGKGDFVQDMTECHQAIDRAISLNGKGE